MHNMEGRCAKDVVQVNEYVGEEEFVPFCDSYALMESMIAKPAAAMRSTLPGGVQQDWSAGGMPQSQGTSQPSGDIGCSVHDCIHYRDFYCWADRIKIQAPEDAGSTLSPCATYTRKR